MEEGVARRTAGELAGMRLSDILKPLRLSLLILPVILFSTRALVSTRYDKEDVLQVPFSIYVFSSS